MTNYFALANSLPTDRTWYWPSSIWIRITRIPDLLSFLPQRLRIDDTRAYQMHELLTGARYIWHGARNFVEIDPSSVPAQVFRVLRRMRTEQQFEYFL